MSYSATVQAEVYFRNLIAAERNREGKVNVRNRGDSGARGGGALAGGGGVRMVSAEEEGGLRGTRRSGESGRRLRAGSGGT